MRNRYHWRKVQAGIENLVFSHSGCVLIQSRCAFNLKIYLSLLALWWWRRLVIVSSCRRRRRALCKKPRPPCSSCKTKARSEKWSRSTTHHLLWIGSRERESCRRNVALALGLRNIINFSCVGGFSRVRSVLRRFLSRPPMYYISISFFLPFISHMEEVGNKPNSYVWLWANHKIKLGEGYEMKSQNLKK